MLAEAGVHAFFPAAEGQEEGGENHNVDILPNIGRSFKSGQVALDLVCSLPHSRKNCF